MAGQETPNNGVVRQTSQSGPATQGTPTAGQQSSQPRPPGGTAPVQRQSQLGLQELNQIVLEYLVKKGYTKTEAMLRMESSRTPTPAQPFGQQQQQSRPISASRPETPHKQPAEDPGLYVKAYALLKNWTETSLDLYKPELRRLLFPVFVYIFLDLIAKNHCSTAKQFFDKYCEDHETLHGHDIQTLQAISLPQHLEENALAKLFRKNEYRIRISRTSFDLLLFYLHEIESSGGNVIIRLLNQHMDTKITNQRPSIFDNDMVLDPEEGLPDHTADKFNTVQPVKLGSLPMDPDFKRDVTAALQVEDAENPPPAGTASLVEEFNSMVKTEETAESPAREVLPLPAYKAVDIEAEIQKVADSRAKVRLGATQAALPSVCMYTFHNTHEGLNVVDFSEDSTLVAGGFSDSFVKIWSLKGEKISSVLRDDEPSTSKRLVGHAGAIYGLSFSPDNRYLLSSSEDKTVRLWSLDTYTALVSYKGHNHPVWDVKFSPYGHYFATASHDQTARLWSCDHIYPLRIFAGHLSDVDTVTFHPNGTYIITGSSDKTCRMWDVSKGNSVRVFIGHTGPINCVAVSPDGRWMASAGEDSIINVWDLGSGRRLKTMRGHGRASIYSLAFSREGSVLVSAGADYSVRTWNIKKGTNDAGPEPEAYDTTKTNGLVNEATRVNSDRKKKEIIATPDHMAVFHTKRTPVYKVHFTRRNLCLAAGAFSG